MEPPRNHFNGVNEWGYASHWEELGNVDFGNHLALPLIINFRSDRVTSSPYLGAGWLLALVESRFVQVDERQFLMVQPNGTQTTFVRTKATDNVLKGGGEWLAKIEGDTITAWASCGWKMSFVRGKISTISTPKNRKIEYIYSGARVTELRELGVPKLVVEQDPTSGFTRALLFNGKRIEISLADRPRVQTLSGQNVVGGIDPSLNTMAIPGAPHRRYDFAVNDQLQPTLKLSGAEDRLFTWDPSTKRIISDNGWTYEIKPGAALGAFAEVGRRNDKGETELWYLDRARGRETVKTAAENFMTVTTRFTGTGILANKLRKIEMIQDGKTRIVQSTVYDETGLLQRTNTERGDTETYFYDARKRLTKILLRNAENAIREKRYNESGKLTHMLDFDRRMFEYRYNSVGKEEEILIDGKRHLLRTWSSDGKTEVESIFGDDPANPDREFTTSYDETGRRLAMHIKEAQSKLPAQVVRFAYDAYGGVTTATKSAQ